MVMLFRTQFRAQVQVFTYPDTSEESSVDPHHRPFFAKEAAQIEQRDQDNQVRRCRRWLVSHTMPILGIGLDWTRRFEGWRRTWS